jgi:hypothetical protein
VDYKIEINVTELQILDTQESQDSFLDTESHWREWRHPSECESECESINDSIVILVIDTVRDTHERENGK